ncbi:MAG: 30S ribosomal protein S1 [Candidatus Margulisbacteria bacterium]|nr:30S ribosomal protein S1 [Candidatus Margulisiibacteriota bacterium]
MAEELKATNINSEKGKDEFFEVEELIKETLEESKTITKKEPPAPAPTPAEQPADKPTPMKKEEFQGTKISQPAKPKTTVASPQKPATPSTYEATFKEYKADDIVKGTVVKVDPNGVLVDIKYKADGLIPIEELSTRGFNSPEEIVKVGDEIHVFIEKLESKEGYVLLSKKRADEEVCWKSAFNAYRSKGVIEGKVVQVLQGGLVLDCNGLRGFIPASQVLKKAGENLDSFKDKTLPVKVIEINRRHGKVVLSHKLAASAKEKHISLKLLEEIQVGQVRKGKVTSLKNFGAFVDLGGIEGLIHLSELSWKRVKHPSEVLKVGQELDVFVLGVDKVNKKIALGLKELQPDPWVNASDVYKAGQIVKVKVLRFAKFGAFVELENGLEGLIHNTELARQPVQNPADAVKIDDVVEAKILRVLPEEQKIGLSIKAAQREKEREEIKKSTPAEDVQKVTIADMIAQKEKEKAEREAEEGYEEEEAEEQEQAEAQETNEEAKTEAEGKAEEKPETPAQ